ncbi:MAG: ComEC/Rec2 family competence protein [Bacteroidales bacterium]
MDRGVTSYIAAFLTGILIARYINLYTPMLLLITGLLLALIVVLKRAVHPIRFIIFAHLVFLLLGMSHFAINSRSMGLTGTSAPPIREQLSLKLENITGKGKEHAVLSALTLGCTSELPADLKRAYSNSGAMHILSLSGLHIGIIYSMVCICLSFLNFSYKTKLIKFLLSVSIIFFYAYITGFSPSVQRAGIMIMVYNLATMGNRPPQKYTTLAIASFIITLLNPDQLFSIGFQLSFAAMVGIIAILPVIEKSFKMVYPDKLSEYRYLKKGAFAVWGTIAISVACQITTLPFTMYYFNSSAPFFLLTNMAVVPLATLILYLFLPVLLLYGVPGIGDFMCNLLVWLLKLMNHVIEFIG